MLPFYLLLMGVFQKTQFCPADWVNLGSYGCYKFLTEIKVQSWFEALVACRLSGGVLANLEDDVTRVALGQLSGHHYAEFWYIGMYRMGNTKNWKWINKMSSVGSFYTGHSSAYENYDDGSHHCAALRFQGYGYKVEPISCFRSSYFSAAPLCEYLGGKHESKTTTKCATSSTEHPTTTSGYKGTTKSTETTPYHKTTRGYGVTTEPTERPTYHKTSNGYGVTTTTTTHRGYVVITKSTITTVEHETTKPTERPTYHKTSNGYGVKTTTTTNKGYVVTTKSTERPTYHKPTNGYEVKTTTTPNKGYKVATKSTERPIYHKYSSGYRVTTKSTSTTIEHKTTTEYELTTTSPEKPTYHKSTNGYGVTTKSTSTTIEHKTTTSGYESSYETIYHTTPKGYEVTTKSTVKTVYHKTTTEKGYDDCQTETRPLPNLYAEEDYSISAILTWYKYGNGLYHLVATASTWSVAVVYCKTIGGRLPVALTPEVLQEIELVKHDQHVEGTVFLGGNDIECEGRWVWNNGSRVDEYSFGGIMFNLDPNRNCLAYDNGLIAVDCDVKSRFICAYNY